MEGDIDRGAPQGSIAARAVAFYLPQFHPIPENDRWWGPGFTEWSNTARARPLYPGHRQPDLPSELGFYDLRLAQSRHAQSELARAHGVAAFCYWHYWFGNGRRILQTPLQLVLDSHEPDIPFCLGWANQSWTGIWHGASDQVLIEQTYPGAEDDRAHFDAILPTLRDERYLRVDGRPVFYVFRPEELPNAAEWVERWQTMARDAGLGGLYLVAEVSDLLGQGPTYTGVAADGFDSGVYMRLPAQISPAARLRMRFGRKVLRWPEIYRYSDTPMPMPASLPERLHQPAVYCNWDNTPRSGRKGLVLHGATPEKFRTHLRAAVEMVAARPADERLVWIKSWNEWAEGNHLEPDERFGRDWLRVVHDEVGGSA